MACEPKPEDGKEVGRFVFLGNNSQCEGSFGGSKAGLFAHQQGGHAGCHAECSKRCSSGAWWAAGGHYVSCEVDWSPEVTLSHSGTRGDSASIYISVRIRQRLGNPM